MMKQNVKLSAVLLTALFLLGMSACGSNSGNSTTGANDESQNKAASASAAIDEKAQQYADNTNPIAIIEMDTGGVIVMELYKNIAPITVQNYISLANSGFYDGLTFHRIDPTFMIQGGDPDGNGTGGPGYEIEGEFSDNGHKNDLSHTRGVVSMARRGSQTNPASMYNTAGSQFFICVQDSTFLDGQYAAFGKVLEGMDVVDEIANAERNGETPVSPRVMKTVRVAQGGTITETSR